MEIYVVISKKDRQFTSLEDVYTNEAVAKQVVKQLNKCSQMANLGFEYLYYCRKLR